MGVRFPSVVTNTFVGPLPANANETVVATLPPLTLPLDGATVFISYSCDLTPGASVTSHVFRLRRGTTVVSALVNFANFVSTVTAGARLMSSGFYFDNPGAVGPVQYSLTVVQTAATGAGVFNDVAMMAFAL
jgi:hypothetical protein